ncbi:hypothetical protein BG003_004481 [Podila horticola]|nr:hypothetical protein BG003_004481 [Podila horticola]
MKSTQSTQSFSKSKMLSLPFVLGLLLATVSASPIPHSRLPRRDEQPQACPGTLRGPSGNAYFAFSTKLNNEVAKKACASCYGGVLANVGVSDLQFLGANLEQSSWIKSWNGDDYSNSCLTIQPSSGAEPGVDVDGACASQNWPLCQATSDIPDSLLRVEDSVTLNSLAVAYTLSQVTPKVETDESIVAALETTDNGTETAETGLTASNGANVDIPATTEQTTAQPQTADPVTVDTTPKAVPAPETVNQEATVAVTEQKPWTAAVIAEAPTPVAVTERKPWTAAVIAEAPAPVAKAPAPIVETPASITEAPAPIAQSVDPLMADKEKVRAAFEENLQACSAELAYGEQDPIANEYMIEHMAETASCSQARYAAQAARLAKKTAVWRRSLA